jgi:5-methyltetrahydropteroyltriglutamate--homocysteine methyltransferase
VVRLNPPFRADQVGSLLRPPGLTKARESYDAGRLPLSELKAIEDRAIRDVIAVQEGIGLKSISDGEFRRRSFWMDFLMSFSGVGIEYEASSGWDFTDASGHKMKAPKATVKGKVRWTGPGATGEFEFLKNNTKGSPRLTIPSPVMLHYYGGRENIDAHAYPDLDEFWADLAAGYRAQIKALFDLGCRFIQIDETTMAKLCDPDIREHLRRRGDDANRLVRQYAAVLNAVLADRSVDMTIGLHLCRGNQRGHWQASGSYEFVADVLFNEVNADCYFLEYDSPRAGSFTPLSKLPPGKVAVLGLISTKTPELERRDDLLRRIDEASRIIPLDRICISPQCGFASGMYGNPITLDDQTRKLELLVSVADEVWNERGAKAIA